MRHSQSLGSVARWLFSVLRRGRAQCSSVQRRGRGPQFAALFFAAIALSATSAEAGKAVAIPCEDDPFYCQTAPISYSIIDSLPIEWNFDTGWVPQNSPLQVHIWAGVYASTRVSLVGDLFTTWTKDEVGILGLATPGRPGGGKLMYNYGAELGAQAAVHISVLGQQFDWVGDLPYIPQFDFKLQASEEFDAWAFPPGFALSSKTQNQTLAKIGIGDIIGGSIPGIDGGFQLDVAMELKATYTTQKIVILEAETPVQGGPILSQDGVSSSVYSGGAYQELDIHPEGTVDYDGVLHLIPAFYVKLLGQNWSIPVADIPIAFPITQTDWVFDSFRVHTPLPDLHLPVTEVNFGKVEVGQKNLEAFDLENLGEAKLAIAMAGESELFELWDTALEVDPKSTVQSAFRFVPKQAGEFETTVLISSNDPDAPLQKVLLKGTGIDGPPLTIDTEDLPRETVEDDIEEVGSCGCRVASETNNPGAGAFAMALMALGLFGRRRRQRK